MYEVASQVLQLLLLEDFFDQYWQQKPLHINPSYSDYFSGLPDLHELEVLLSTRDLIFPAEQLAKSTQAVAVSDYTDDDNRKILPLRLLDHHHSGATIVVSQAQKRFQSRKTKAEGESPLRAKNSLERQVFIFD